jgi:hypothetical protein
MLFHVPSVVGIAPQARPVVSPFQNVLNERVFALQLHVGMSVPIGKIVSIIGRFSQKVLVIFRGDCRISSHLEDFA